MQAPIFLAMTSPPTMPSYKMYQDKAKASWLQNSSARHNFCLHHPHDRATKDKGKAYLQRDNTIWFFDPADKKFTSTSAKDSFQNTNVQQKDFAPQAFLNDYSIAEAKKEKLGSLDVVYFYLKAKTNQADYPIVKIWVSEDGLLRKKEEYSLSGQLLRSTAIPSYQKVRSNNIERFLPVAMLIVDNLRGKKIDGKMDYEKTQVSIKNVSFEKLSDLVYTKQYLELAH